MITERKNSIWNMIGATLNAFTSLIFNVIVIRINGDTEAGIFSYAYATAAVLFVIGTYIIRPFQVTDISGKYTDSDYVIFKLFSCSAMLLAAAVFCICKQYSLYKSAIIILLTAFRMVEALCETFYAIVQKAVQLYRAGISMTLKAILDVLIFITVECLLHNLIIAIAAMIAVNIAILAAVDIPNAGICMYTKSKFDFKKAKLLFCGNFFAFILSFLNIYLINASRYAIDDLCSERTQMIFGIIIIPATFMCLLGQYIIQPALTTIAEAIRSCDYPKIRSVIFRIITALLIIGAFVFVVAYFLEAPVLGFIYGINLNMYKKHMLIIIAGSVMYGLEVVLTYILIALRSTAGSALAFATVSLAATIASYKAVINYELLGAAIVYSVSMLLLALILSGILFYNMKKIKLKWN